MNNTVEMQVHARLECGEKQSVSFKHQGHRALISDCVYTKAHPLSRSLELFSTCLRRRYFSLYCDDVRSDAGSWLVPNLSLVRRDSNGFRRYNWHFREERPSQSNKIQERNQCDGCWTAIQHSGDNHIKVNISLKKRNGTAISNYPIGKSISR